MDFAGYGLVGEGQPRKLVGAEMTRRTFTNCCCLARACVGLGAGVCGLSRRACTTTPPNMESSRRSPEDSVVPGSRQVSLFVGLNTYFGPMKVSALSVA